MASSCTIDAAGPTSRWYSSIVSNTCEGRPRSVMMTGPRFAARLARLVSWLNSRLDTLVVALVVRLAAM